MQIIPGGVCAAKGFTAAGLYCGLKKKEKPDLALIVSEVPASAAAVYTRNVVKAAPLHISKRHMDLSGGILRAVVINSGNANACAPEGEENALAMCVHAAAALGVPTEQVIVSSTGVIGQTMTPKMHLVTAGITDLVPMLAGGVAGSDLAAQAIMTTDLTQKELALSFSLGGVTVHMGGIAKGSGMIHPNMGTMLGFLTTDAAISPALLQKALRLATDRSFNRLSVDGDSSTNDFCVIMANGKAGNPEIREGDADYETFLTALTEICVYLTRAIASDGEGATHLITCTVKNAPSELIATTTAKSVISSSLVKSAVFGKDANWGRILCAMGYAGVEFDPERVAISLASEAGEVQVCERGRGLAFDEELGVRVLTPHEVEIRIDMGQGDAQSTCWGCDLTYDYVKINGSYRS